MTPAEAEEKVALEMIDFVRDQVAKETHLGIAIRAALRERDAEHEVALKKARADALDEAILVFELPESLRTLAQMSRDKTVYVAVCDAVAALRALLEEAGGNG